MIVNDAHVHFRGGERLKPVLAAMDTAGIAKIGAISPKPGKDVISQIAALEALSPLLKEAPDRLYGLAYINPLLEDAPDIVQKAVQKLGYRGVKMAPDHWYPYDERILPLYSCIENLRIPILFHSGIIWYNGDSSRFCKPVNFEVLINFPGIRFALAHIGWPWTDECIALGGRFAADHLAPDIGFQEHAPRPRREDVAKAQMFVDITLGAPRPFRRNAISLALAAMGDNRILFGSDTTNAEDAEALRFHKKLDIGILREECGASEEAIGRIMRENFEIFFGNSPGTDKR